MKTYKQFVFEIVKRVEDMKNLSGDDIIKGMSEEWFYLIIEE